MKRHLSAKYVTSDKWCNLCFATTNGILTCRHGLLLDLSGILGTSSPPPQRASRPNLQVGTWRENILDETLETTLDLDESNFTFTVFTVKKNGWNPEMLGQCLRSFQRINQQSWKKSLTWRQYISTRLDMIHVSCPILVQKTEQHAAGSQSIGSQQDSARKIDFILFGCDEFWYLHSCWSPLGKLCKLLSNQSSSLANPNLLSVVDRFTLLQRSPTWGKKGDNGRNCLLGISNGGKAHIPTGSAV